MNTSLSAELIVPGMLPPLLQLQVTHWREVLQGAAVLEQPYCGPDRSYNALLLHSPRYVAPRA